MPSSSPQGQPPFVPALHSGSRVVLVVSRGPRLDPPSAFVDVPAVVGLPQGEALAALQKADLDAQVFNDFSDAYPRGTVTGQLPRPGESAPSESEVVLLVSSGPAASHTSMAILPKLAGERESDAVIRLQEAGLSPQLVRDFDPVVEAGRVVASLPDAESLSHPPVRRQSRLAWGLTAAALLIGAALFFAFTRSATVPNVVGLTQAQAQDAVSAAGFRVGSVTTSESASAAPGSVIAQTPASGETARKGSAVDLVLAAGPALVAVPDVVGKPESAAVAALKEAGLASSVATAFSDTAAAGAVLAATPGAGERVPAGTTVGLTVSAGPEPRDVRVPALTGLTEAAAKQAAEKAGLRTQSIDAFSATVATGTVISQLPAADSLLPPGSAVGIVVSRGPQPPAASVVAVPDVAGLSAQEATARLTSAGFVVSSLPQSGTGRPAGTVAGQIPNAGASAPKGSTVVLLVSNGG